MLGQFSDFHGNLNGAHGKRAMMSDQPTSADNAAAYS